MALNTILTDSQLPAAEKLIKQLYEIGADALIVQDMGILKMNIPPIALHASTQTDNSSIEKIKFLQDAGFSRVVLARELTLEQIKGISRDTNLELECFVHGALCVSYSGQCYISQAMTGRSANRGECAQYCRLPYTLTDADGNLLIKNKHLLSLKDLDLSAHLEELIEAGITSFKIEGRLKDVNYVKNITAHYRKKLDNILERRTDIKKSSEGKTYFFFEPNPEKSFRRGETDFFLNGRQAEIWQPDTPKSMGEEIGKVVNIENNFIEIYTDKEVHNGDGLCFLDKNGVLQGFNVNQVSKSLKGIKVKCGIQEKITAGTIVFRNQDQEFDKILKNKTSERLIGVELLFSETKEGFSLQATDEENIQVSKNFVTEKQPARNPANVQSNIKNQLSKLGNTIYEAQDITLNLTADWFLPASKLNEWRREIIDLLDKKRAENYHRETRKPAENNIQFPEKKLTYMGNVVNKKAEEFYRQAGVEEIMPGFEVRAEEGVPLMFCRHCIKHSMGWCPKEGYKANFKEPLYITHSNQKFRLEFDCKKCEMKVLKN